MRTFILKWNPAISSVTMADMKWSIADAYDSLDSDFDWSVYEWEKAKKGDRVFMLRVGRGKTGIMASGYFSSDPYEDNDWRGTDQKKYYAQIIFDCMIFPLGNDILEQKALLKEIPTVDWKGGHSGVLISEEESNKLEQVWNTFLKENDYLNCTTSDSTFFQSLLIRAWGIAFHAHKGQVDKAGKNYFEAHIMDVFEKVNPLYDDNENCVTEIVALLHDVVEDTGWTIEQLKAQGFTDEMLEALACVTKQYGESYDHFVERAKSNKYAKAVKIADLKSNMDITRLDELTEVDIERLRKYHKAYKYLIAD